MMKKSMLGIMSVLVVQAIAGTAVAAGGVSPADWRLSRFARIEGNILVVDVPKGAKEGSARTTVDLSGCKNGVQLFIRARGKDVTRPELDYHGTKFMLHYTDGDGVEQWPGAAQKSGTFDWCGLRFAKKLGKGVKGGSAELTLGLQNASGRMEFDLSTLRIVEMGDEWSVPEEDKGYRCEYDEDVRSRPVHRGVMLPSGPCREDDFITLRSWGANLARYQMCRDWSRQGGNRDLAEYDRWLEGKLDHLDREVLPWAVKYGIELVVDLHVLPGGRYQDELSMFYEKEYADHFLECWRRIATRFRGREGIYAFDLVNEPNQLFPGSADIDYWNLQRRAAELIREIDPKTPIVIESNGWDAPQNFSYLRPLRLKNIIYQAHMYQPMAFTHQGVKGRAGWKPTKYPDEEKGWNRDYLRKALQDVRDFELEHGARIYIGEFSAIAWAEGAENYLRDCISIFEEYGWDWSYHAFREWDGWSVEKTCAAPGDHYLPSADNPRMRALKDGFVKGF